MAATAAVAALAAGCTAADAVPDSTPEVAVLRLDTPVREPVWSKEAGAVVALAESEPRVVKFTPGESAGRMTARTTLSDRIPGLGENLAPSATGEHVLYVPRPDADRVAVLDSGTLRVKGSLRAGEAPAHVTVDSGADVLLALSRDGATVTGVDVQPDPGEDPAVVTRNEVRLGPAGEVDGPDRGRLIEFHTVGPDLISHYKGAVGEVEKTAALAFRAETTTGDLVKVSRLYAAEKGTDRLVAIDVSPGGDKLREVARSRLGAPVLHLGADENRLYAVTEDRLVVLETNSYEGFPSGEFTVVKSIDYRAALKDARLKEAPVSGLAVGPERVYLTLRGVPHALSVAEPGL
ncbi:YncE family protein [Streptomyces coelicoflavus]|uniref:YncE family protein n=1 Tax=Streptomyces coelicoflavus TaxID=285562 RepID=UPI00368601A0